MVSNGSCCFSSHSVQKNRCASCGYPDAKMRKCTRDLRVCRARVVVVNSSCLQITGL
jgi:ribosomal protein L37E